MIDEPHGAPFRPRPCFVCASPARRSRRTAAQTAYATCKPVFPMQFHHFTTYQFVLSHAACDVLTKSKSTLSILEALYLPTLVYFGACILCPKCVAGCADELIRTVSTQHRLFSSHPIDIFFPCVIGLALFRLPPSLPCEYRCLETRACWISQRAGRTAECFKRWRTS